MNEVDNFNSIVISILASLIEIGPGVVTLLSLEFHILFHLHDLRS